jgi:hypothetical protein
MEVDIIYSITAHEFPESLNDLILNILYYNKKYNVCIVINTNEIIYNDVVNYSKLYNNVIVYPNPWTKNYVGYDIMKSHLQNAEYCFKQNIKSKYFIPLASNCLFHKELNIDNYIKIYPINMNEKHVADGWCWWPNIYSNNIIINFLNSHNIYNLVCKHHEGALYEYDGILQITNFLKETDVEIYSRMNFKPYPYEEVLLPTLYSYFKGHYPGEICKIYWDWHNYVPSFEEVINEHCPCVKRVLREYNDPLRVKLRKRANNYTDIESK